MGVISPYNAQVSLLTRWFNGDAKKLTQFESVLGPHRAMQMRNVEIKSVDGFEGREKEVIIFSTVRNNPEGYIGFLADRRRLNVGLTRAKRGLFIVGSIRTLQESKQTRRQEEDERWGMGAESWRRYAMYLQDHGLVRTVGQEGPKQERREGEKL
jgi:superfamily I DNA and/or RNA helicase